MREVTVSITISAPREGVFDFVNDLAARPSFTDHFMDDYRLARVKPVGVGAAARFRLNRPLFKDYAELTITEADRPRRIIEEIRVGRRGRNRSVAVYDFTRESARATRVELTTFGEPATAVDRLREVGAAGWSAARPASRSTACARSSRSRRRSRSRGPRSRATNPIRRRGSAPITAWTRPASRSTERRS